MNAECPASHGNWKVPTSRQVQHCVFIVKTGETRKDCGFFFFVSENPSFIVLHIFIFFYSPVGLMTTGCFVDIWAHGKLDPIWILSSWMAEPAGSFTACEVPRGAEDPDVNVLVPLRDSWKHDWRFILCSESQHFPPHVIVLATKETMLLGLDDVSKSPGAF